MCLKGYNKYERNFSLFTSVLSESCSCFILIFIYTQRIFKYIKIKKINFLMFWKPKLTCIYFNNCQKTIVVVELCNHFWNFKNYKGLENFFSRTLYNSHLQRKTNKIIWPTKKFYVRLCLLNTLKTRCITIFYCCSFYIFFSLQP